MQNRHAKLILGWILQICVVVLLSNPTGVSGFDFPFLGSSRGLRGAAKTEVVNDADESFNDAFLEDSEDYSLEDLPQEEIDTERQLHPGYYYGKRNYFAGGYGWNNYNTYTHYHYKKNYNTYYYGGGYYNGYYYNNRYYSGYYYRRRTIPYSWYSDDWVTSLNV